MVQLYIIQWFTTSNAKKNLELSVFRLHIAKRMNWYDQINLTWHSVKHLIACVHYGLTYGTSTYVCMYITTKHTYQVCTRMINLLIFTLSLVVPR